MTTSPAPQAFTDPAPDIAREHARYHASSRATPVTNFSACRTGLISDLLLRCGAGDAQAFEAIVDVFFSVVAAAAALELPADEVEAAVETTFVNIWRTAPSYRPGGTTAVEWIMSHVGSAPSRLRA